MNLTRFKVTISPIFRNSIREKPPLPCSRTGSSHSPAAKAGTGMGVLKQAIRHLCEGTFIPGLRRRHLTFRGRSGEQIIGMTKAVRGGGSPCEEPFGWPSKGTRRRAPCGTRLLAGAISRSVRSLGCAACRRARLRPRSRPQHDLAPAKRRSRLHDDVFRCRLDYPAARGILKGQPHTGGVSRCRRTSCFRTSRITGFPP
jgi:hypothetical protein